MANWLGSTLVTDELTEGTISNLITKDDTKNFEFEKAIAQYLKHIDVLPALSINEQKKLLLHRDISPKYLALTLDHIHDQIDAHRKHLKTAVLTQQQHTNAEADGREIALERRKTELKNLRDHVEVQIQVKNIPAIIRAVTQAVKKGWMFGGIPVHFQQAAIKWDMNQFNHNKPTNRVQTIQAPQYATQNNASGRGRSNNTRGRGGGRGRGRGRGGAAQYTTRTYQTPTVTPANSKTYPTPPQFTTRTRSDTRTRRIQPQPPNQLWSRTQYATHIPKVYDPNLTERINWTLLRFVTAYCNNFQIWGQCAVHQKASSLCTYIRRCSNCDSQEHGRRKCPHLPKDESADA